MTQNTSSRPKTPQSSSQMPPVSGDWLFHQSGRGCTHPPLSGLSLSSAHIHPKRSNTVQLAITQSEESHTGGPQIFNITKQSPLEGPSHTSGGANVYGQPFCQKARL